MADPVVPSPTSRPLDECFTDGSVRADTERELIDFESDATPVVPLPEQPADDVKVSYFVVGICDLCRSGVPGECHVPGCAFWMQPAPGLGRVQMLTLLPAKFEFNEAYADSVWKVERASRG